MKSLLTFWLMAILTLFGLIAPLSAQTALHDPNLPTVKPQVLHQLANNRVRQRIMAENQAHYDGRCVCPYQTRDTNKQSCKGRHELIKTKPPPICYPRQITDEMVSNWRRRHP
jgi:hypothetical protein